MKSGRKSAAGAMVFLFCLIGSSGCASAPGLATTTPSPAPITVTLALTPFETPQPIATSTATPVQEEPSTSIHPIVIYPPYESSSGYLLGGTLDGKWLDAATAASYLKGGESYSLYTDTNFLGTSIGTAPEVDGPTCRWMQWVTLDPSPQAVNVVAISGEWNALPRIPQDISTENWIYLQAVNDLLVANGIADPKVQLTRVLKIDLEGDGVDEILVNASYFHEESGHDVTQGDYSIVILRKVMGNEVITLPMPADFYDRSEQVAMPEKYTLTAILDLNGDGRMEIIVGITGWEKVGSLVYEVVDFEARNILGVQCP